MGFDRTAILGFISEGLYAHADKTVQQAVGNLKRKPKLREASSAVVSTRAAASAVVVGDVPPILSALTEQSRLYVVAHCSDQILGNWGTEDVVLFLTRHRLRTVGVINLLACQSSGGSTSFAKGFHRALKEKGGVATSVIGYNGDVHILDASEIGDDSVTIGGIRVRLKERDPKTLKKEVAAAGQKWVRLPYKDPEHRGLNMKKLYCWVNGEQKVGIYDPRNQSWSEIQET